MHNSFSQFVPKQSLLKVFMRCQELCARFFNSIDLPNWINLSWPPVHYFMTTWSLVTDPPDTVIDLIAVFTRQQFNKGPLLIISMVVKWLHCVPRVNGNNVYTVHKGQQTWEDFIGTLDSPKIVVLSHEVLFVKFHKHAQTKQGTPVKMLRVKRATHNMLHDSGSSAGVFIQQRD